LFETSITKFYSCKKADFDLSVNASIWNSPEPIKLSYPYPDGLFEPNFPKASDICENLTFLNFEISDNDDGFTVGGTCSYKYSAPIGFSDYGMVYNNYSQMCSNDFSLKKRQVGHPFCGTVGCQVKFN
jgi:hypothetical protein